MWECEREGKLFNKSFRIRCMCTVVENKHECSYWRNQVQLTKKCVDISGVNCKREPRIIYLYSLCQNSNDAWLTQRLNLLLLSRSWPMPRPPHLPLPRHRSMVCMERFSSHTLQWYRWLLNNRPLWWLAHIPLRRILTCFTRPSRERYSLCNHLNLLYNHKHKWVNKSSRDHFLIDFYSFLGCSLWKASAKRLPGINSGVLHSVHHLQSHLHYHRHTCTVALNQGQWTNTNSLAGLFFNLLYYFSLVLANNNNYVNKTNFDIQAHNEKGTGNYKKAKRFGNIAIYLTLVNIIYTLFIDTLIVGLAISLRCEFLHIMSNRHVVKHSINLF